MFYSSISPLCFRSPGLSQPRGSDSILCQPLAVSSIPASLSPPARRPLPALGSGSMRPSRPQLLHTPSPTLAEGWQPQHPEGLALRLAALGAGSTTLSSSPPPPPPLSPVTRVLFPPLCLLPAQDSLLPSRPWLEAHNETASPHRSGGGESPWQPRKPLLPLLPFLSWLHQRG